MRFLPIFLLLGIVAPAFAGGLTDGPARSLDVDRFQGSWCYYSLLLGNEPAPDPADLADLPLLRISGNRGLFIEKGKENQDAREWFSFTIDPLQNPKTIDIQGIEDKKNATWK